MMKQLSLMVFSLLTFTVAQRVASPIPNEGNYFYMIAK